MFLMAYAYGDESDTREIESHDYYLTGEWKKKQTEEMVKDPLFGIRFKSKPLHREEFR